MPELVGNLIAFLTKPEAAPPGTAVTAAALTMGMGGRTAYPQGVTPLPSRYKTGYGNEPHGMYELLAVSGGNPFPAGGRRAPGRTPQPVQTVHLAGAQLRLRAASSL
jgi:hypothetical protein